jgi:hypothetical protein
MFSRDTAPNRREMVQQACFGSTPGRSMCSQGMRECAPLCKEGPPVDYWSHRIASAACGASPVAKTPA